MRNKLIIFKGIAIAFLAFTLTTACTKDKKSATAKAPEAKPSTSNFLGYWVSGGDDSKNIIQIELTLNEATQKFETRLIGFDMKPYSGQPTTIWSKDSAAPVDQTDRPVLEISENGDARTTIDNISLRRGDNSHVVVNIKISLASENSLFISHGTTNGTQTHERFLRLDATTGAQRFTEVARERSRELARLYLASNGATDCKSINLTTAIEHFDLGCVREIAANNDNISEQDLTVAAKNLDYGVVKFLMPRFQGSTDNIIAQVSALPASQPQSINGGKYFSLELDREPILALLMTRASTRQ